MERLQTAKTKSLLQYPLYSKRRQTRIVKIGTLEIGGNNPILVQSMLTSATGKVEACLAEIKELVEARCQLIRLTLTSRKELDSIRELRRLMKEEGIGIPLVADIHFSQKLAIEACELFEKVRINPGNFSDKPKNSKAGKAIISFEEGKEQLGESLKPLVENLKKYQRALRVGVNQGSFSTRIMDRYGDTPEGMVASAVEVVELLEEQLFHQIVISLKSSNPLVVQKAYRLLDQKLPKENGIPLHLGVTEAGAGLSARIKSLAGIGPLILDGFGDTVRVSLTEPSRNEIPVAENLINLSEAARKTKPTTEASLELPLSSHRLINQSVEIGMLKLGAGSPLKIGKKENCNFPECEFKVEEDFKFEIKDNRILLGGNKKTLQIKEPIRISSDITKEADAIIFDFESPLYQIRSFYQQQKNLSAPLPCGMLYPVTGETEKDKQLEIEMAAILGEGYLDFLLIPPELNPTVFERMLHLIQATRSKIFFTDYISCPSCGRTLFDIQATTEKIKKRTSHLTGLKIGIMGCIVNGPGEMADADVGYVGSGSGKIDLYLGKKVVQRGIDEEKAVDALLDLIKSEGLE